MPWWRAMPKSWLMSSTFLSVRLLRTRKILRTLCLVRFTYKSLKRSQPIYTHFQIRFDINPDTHGKSSSIQRSYAPTSCEHSSLTKDVVIRSIVDNVKLTSMNVTWFSEEFIYVPRSLLLHFWSGEIIWWHLTVDTCGRIYSGILAKTIESILQCWLQVTFNHFWVGGITSCRLRKLLLRGRRWLGPRNPGFFSSNALSINKFNALEVSS